MNQRDIAEIKRRLNPDRRNPTVIRGCYVDYTGSVISSFTEAVARLTEAENAMYMKLFKGALSGTAGQNLLPISFTPEQTMNDEAYAVLSALRNSSLRDDDAVASFCSRAVAGILAEHPDTQSVSDAREADNWLILLMHDGYDVPYRDDNGEIDRERSTDVFSYILACICPVKQSRPGLSYMAAESGFHERVQDWVVSAPAVGLMFPAYEERSADVYSALFFTKDSSEPHSGFVQNVFNTEATMPASEQKATFQAVLSESLGDECSMEVLTAVHGTVSGMIEKQAADKGAAPLTLSREDVKEVLTECGVSEEKTAAFEEKYEEAFGGDAVLPAVNVVSPRSYRVDTPSVSIRVDPAHSDLVETRVIDGKRYIMVLADGEVELNGMAVRFET